MYGLRYCSAVRRIGVRHRGRCVGVVNAQMSLGCAESPPTTELGPKVTRVGRRMNCAKLTGGSSGLNHHTVLSEAFRTRLPHAVRQSKLSLRVI